MKKTIAILLTLALVLTMSVTAFAADETSLTIRNADGEVVRSYNGYMLLDLSISLKQGEHHPAACNGVDHADDCYNYAYTLNNKYSAILKDEVFSNAGSSFWGAEGKPASAADVTDEQVLEYLASQTSDSGDTYGTLRPVADRIYRAIQTAGLEADKTGMTGKEDQIDQGYWLIADVTDLTGENESNSLVLLDTKGENSITVAPKTAISTVEKKVKDIEDTEDANILDNPWLDSADHDIGDTVPFKLTATLPSNAQYYKSFKLVFHDSLSAGLTLDPDSIYVLMYQSKYKADVDTDLNDGVDVTAYFTKTTSGLTDGCTFEVGCDNVFAIHGVTKETAFVVYYEAQLNDAAAIGAAGNLNEVYLEFSNDPYSDGTGETAKDKVLVFTYQLTVNKTDSHGHALSGAGFTLYKKTIDGQFVQIGQELKGEAMTTFTWTGLDDGDYKLVETTVPEGYNVMADILFSISATHSEIADEPQLISLDGGQMGTGEVSTGLITRDVVNNTGTVLPETGAEGTVMLITGSMVLVMLAVVFLITRKKMSVYED